MTIGERIKALRQKKGWSQRELARLAGVRHATLAELETGMRTETRTDIARRLAQTLGITVDYLVGMYEDTERGDSAPAGVALGSASAHTGRPGAQRRARRGG
jgi:transcriptional regulator with XRE-family HTH domain